MRTTFVQAPSTHHTEPREQVDSALAGLASTPSTAALSLLARPIGLRLLGGRSRAVVLQKDPASGVLTATETAHLPDDGALATAADFVRWRTGGLPWRSVVATCGDHDHVGAVLDALSN